MEGCQPLPIGHGSETRATFQTRDCKERLRVLKRQENRSLSATARKHARPFQSRDCKERLRSAETSREPLPMVTARKDTGTYLSRD
jgi:hypothetical protein